MMMRYLVLCALAVGISSCQSPLEKTKQAVVEELSQQQGTFAVAFSDLATGEQILINENEMFHAASTMKTPVMIEVYKQASEGRFNLSDSIVIKNEFASIVDGSPYSLSPEDDSERELYNQLGTKRTISQLVYDMIIVSSNLATNLVIELVDAESVTASMRTLGADSIQVRRGVEDNKAFQKGLNNTTTAHDLMVIFEKIAKKEAVSAEASQSMIDILLDQQFNDLIPARLPAGVKVAHKTGWITGVHHDSGIVFLPDGHQYVLVLMSKGLKDEKAAEAAMARVSEIIYQHVTGR